MSHKPTDEQARIIDACLTGDNLVIEAAAGSGKTTTLKMVAGATGRRGLYLAYNRAIKDDALKSFPSSVRCVTSHGLAYGPVATKYKHRLGGSRIPPQIAAKILGVNEPVWLDKDLAPLAPAQLVRVATATVARWCYSDADEITARHVPLYPGWDTKPLRDALAAAVVPIAQKAWADIMDPAGRLRFEHDHYLKIYQLTRPTVDVDYLLVDEAQDLNPVVQAIVSYQTHAQVILVGDRCQQLYKWRGAVDAMKTFQGDRLYLTQSFRFGHAVAAEANKWLSILDAQIRVRGFDKVHSVVGPLESPDAVLCRSNAAALGRVIEGLDRGRRVALVGGGGDIARLAKAAIDLKAGRPCDHPELLAFSSWAEVQDYVSQDSTASDLKVFVDLVDRYGPEAMVSLADRLSSEDRADLIVSTAHKAKGREWGRVQIATDFREPKKNDDGSLGEVPEEDAMLAYVAVTRAKTGLDPEGLAWVNRYVTDRTPTIEELIEASSLGTPEAVELRAEGREHLAADLTGMPQEQADWDSDEPDAERVPTHCRRCGSKPCLCDPILAAEWGARTGLPAGPNATTTRVLVGSRGGA